MNPDFDKMQGLLPAVVQDVTTGKVLMLGYMNAEAYQQTLESGKVTFFSRSKNRLWTKGETSGNVLHLHSIQLDCDQDAFLVLATPQGATCHTGNETCFFEQDKHPKASSLSFLSELESLLIERKKTMPEGSYTSKMFAKGLDKITQKVGEEAVETVIASKNDDTGEFIYEASDLLFHLMLLLVQKDIPFSSLIEELKRRHAK